jgi:hypothetical protein
MQVVLGGAHETTPLESGRSSLTVILKPVLLFFCSVRAQALQLVLEEVVTVKKHDVLSI